MQLPCDMSDAVAQALQSSSGLLNRVSLTVLLTSAASGRMGLRSRFRLSGTKVRQGRSFGLRKKHSWFAFYTGVHDKRP